MSSHRRPIPVPILTYHQITPEPHPAFAKYAITPTQLETQLQWLSDNGYVSVHLEHIFGDAPLELPDKPIVLTFDDGFADCVEFGVPLLQRHSFTATFFLVSGLLGQTSRWLVAERGLEYRLMDRSAARALLDWGFECGAHGMNHLRLATLSAAERLHELRDARTVLEDTLGCEICHVAYPFGSFNAAVRNLAESCGYRSAVTVQHGIALTADDPFTLKRIHVIATESPLAFTRALTDGSDQRSRNVATHTGSTPISGR